LIISGIATLMTMTGRGGGNFYVPVLVAAGEPIHEAATTGQFLLLATACAGMLVFHKHKKVDWKLAFVIDPPTDIMAFVGGYFAHLVSGTAMKLALGVLLVVASFCMVLKVKEHPLRREHRVGFWRRKFGEDEYTVNLWVAIPITAVTGLVAGAVGISGGSFKIPLMVLACGVPMRIAVGTSSAMVAATALMGFIGHTAAGDFNPGWTLPIACLAVAGGLVGGRLSLRTDPKKLRLLFALTTLAAAIFMVCHALC